MFLKELNVDKFKVPAEKTKKIKDKLWFEEIVVCKKIKEMKPNPDKDKLDIIFHWECYSETDYEKIS